MLTFNLCTTLRSQFRSSSDGLFCYINHHLQVFLLGCKTVQFTCRRSDEIEIHLGDCEAIDSEAGKLIRCVRFAIERSYKLKHIVSGKNNKTHTTDICLGCFYYRSMCRIYNCYKFYTCACAASRNAYSICENDIDVLKYCSLQ